MSTASINYEALPPTKFKGKQHELPVFAPLHAKATARSGTTIGLQGRDYEYRQLRWMVAELLVYEGAGTIILCGGRGSGKKVRRRTAPHRAPLSRPRRTAPHRAAPRRTAPNARRAQRVAERWWCAAAPSMTARRRQTHI